MTMFSPILDMKTNMYKKRSLEGAKFLNSYVIIMQTSAKEYQNTCSNPLIDQCDRV